MSKAMHRSIHENPDSSTQRIKTKTQQPFDWRISDQLHLENVFIAKENTQFAQFVQQFIDSSVFAPDSWGQVSKLLLLLQKTVRVEIEHQKMLKRELNKANDKLKQVYSISCKQKQQIHMLRRKHSLNNTDKLQRRKANTLSERTLVTRSLTQERNTSKDLLHEISTNQGEHKKTDTIPMNLLEEIAAHMKELSKRSIDKMDHWMAQQFSSLEERILGTNKQHYGTHTSRNDLEANTKKLDLSTRTSKIDLDTNTSKLDSPENKSKAGSTSNKSESQKGENQIKTSQIINTIDTTESKNKIGANSNISIINATENKNMIDTNENQKKMAKNKNSNKVEEKTARNTKNHISPKKGNHSQTLGVRNSSNLEKLSKSNRSDSKAETDKEVCFSFSRPSFQTVFKLKPSTYFAKTEKENSFSNSNDTDEEESKSNSVLSEYEISHIRKRKTNTPFILDESDELLSG